jgi:hypothetical protein
MVAIATVTPSQMVSFYSKCVYPEILLPELFNDVGFAYTSSGQSPDDGRKATTSWQSHDPSEARTSSGLHPDDGRKATTSWLCHDQIVEQ